MKRTAHAVHYFRRLLNWYEDIHLIVVDLVNNFDSIIFLQPLKSTAGVSRRFLLDLVQQQEADLQENDQHIRKLLAAVKERDVELENYDRLLDSHVLVNNALDTLQQCSLTLTSLIVTENFEKERWRNQWIEAGISSVTGER